MLPIRDTIRSLFFSPGNLDVIALTPWCSFGWGWAAELDALISGFGWSRRDYPFYPFTFQPLLTIRYLHGCWVHFLGNV
jgi:hypothetical protein